jgi:hypothetical protein
MPDSYDRSLRPQTTASVPNRVMQTCRLTKQVSLQDLQRNPSDQSVRCYEFVVLVSKITLLLLKIDTTWKIPYRRKPDLRRFSLLALNLAEAKRFNRTEFLSNPTDFERILDLMKVDDWQLRNMFDG